MSPYEPSIKRVIAFIDGQNLLYAARNAFGYAYPNYDPQALAEKICQQQGWNLQQVKFYTGVPDINDDQFWHNFWSRKIVVMGQKGSVVYSRKLRYRNQTVSLPNGQAHTFEVRVIAKEQGRWIKIASAFPVSPTARNIRGINNTDWIKIDRKTYDACIDPNDYRKAS